MEIDIAKYDINRDFVINWYIKKGKGDIRHSISTLSPMTRVPLIAVAYWIAEHTSYHQDAMDAIRSYIKFYGYTKIKGIPEGAPEL